MLYPFLYVGSVLFFLYLFYSVSIPRLSYFVINHIILPLGWNFCPKVFQIYGRLPLLGLVGTPHLFLPMEFWVIWVCSGVSSFYSGSNLYSLSFDTSSSYSASIPLYLPSSCHIMSVLVPVFGGGFLHVQSMSLGLIQRQLYYWCLVGVLSVALDLVWRLFWHNVSLFSYLSCPVPCWVRSLPLDHLDSAMFFWTLYRFYSIYFYLFYSVFPGVDTTLLSYDFCSACMVFHVLLNALYPKPPFFSSNRLPSTAESLHIKDKPKGINFHTKRNQNQGYKYTIKYTEVMRRLYIII